MECHTPKGSKGAPDLSMKFAGGMLFETPSGSVVSANITPHDDTGIGKWDYARFAERFRPYRPYVENGPPSAGPERSRSCPGSICRSSRMRTSKRSSRISGRSRRWSTRSKRTRKRARRTEVPGLLYRFAGSTTP